MMSPSIQRGGSGPESTSVLHVPVISVVQAGKAQRLLPIITPELSDDLARRSCDTRISRNVRSDTMKRRRCSLCPVGYCVQEGLSGKGLRGHQTSQRKWRARKCTSRAMQACNWQRRRGDITVRNPSICQRCHGATPTKAPIEPAIWRYVSQLASGEEAGWS